MIASIDLTTSVLISVVWASACWASVRFLGFVGLWLELLLQQKVEFVRFERSCRRRLLCWIWVGHNCSPLWVARVYDDGSSCGFLVVTRVCNSVGSWSSRLTSSSAPLLPSM